MTRIRRCEVKNVADGSPLSAFVLGQLASEPHIRQPRLFVNFAKQRGLDRLAVLHCPCRNLGSGFRVLAVIKNEQLSLPVPRSSHVGEDFVFHLPPMKSITVFRTSSCSLSMG